MDRRTAVFALVAAAAATSSLLSDEARAQGDALWNECRVEVLTGSARRVRCPDLTMSLSQGLVVSQDAWLGSTASRIADGAPVVTEPLDVDGHVITLRIVRGRLVRVIASPRAETVAVCDVSSSSELDRCRDALAWIARRGLPPGVTFPEPRLEILGRSLLIPRGCQLVGAERIACSSGAALGWRSGTPSDPRTTIQRYAASLRTQFPNTRAEEVACVVAGRVGLGARFVLGAERTIVCAVEDGTGTALAQCIGDLQPGSNWPEPCSQVFEGAVPQ